MTASLRLLAGVVVGLLAAVAHAGGRAAVDGSLQPLPGSRAAQRLAWQRAESYAHMPQAVRYAAESGPLLWGAANFEALGTPQWLITHQDITVDLNAAQSKVSLTVVATVRANDKTSQLSFALSQLDTATVQFGGQPFAAQHQKIGAYSLLTLDLADPLTATSEVQVTVQGSASIDCSPQGVGLRPCGVGNTYQWLTFWRYYLSPGLNAHNPFTSELHVITAGDKMAAAPGQPVGVNVLPDGRKIYHFKQIERTENAGFGIAGYQPSQTQLDTGVDLNVYVTPKFAKDVQPLVAMAKDVVAWYGARFGPFPWPVLNLIQLENNFGGGYAPLSGVFMLRDTFAAQPDTQFWDNAVELTAHELGHQWWGNLVEPYTAGDVSLSESLAEYASCFYTETKLKSRAQILGNHLSYLYTVAPTSDTPLGAQNVYASADYVQIVYHKGAAVVDMLRRQVGDELAHQALALYAKKFNRDFARVDDLRSAFEQVTGVKLDWFFQQWFQRKGHIEAELTGRIVDDNGKLALRLRIRQLTAKPYRFTANLSIDYRGGQTEVVPLDVDTKGEADFVTQVPLSARPVRVRVDGQRLLLRQFATGTPGDFNLSGLVDGADLVELALRHGRAVSVTGKNGQNYFFSDTAWNELYDLKADLRVNDGDVEALDAWIGLEAEAF
jgi:aminopeptidase N